MQRTDWNNCYITPKGPNQCRAIFYHKISIWKSPNSEQDKNKLLTIKIFYFKNILILKIKRLKLLCVNYVALVPWCLVTRSHYINQSVNVLIINSTYLKINMVIDYKWCPFLTWFWRIKECKILPLSSLIILSHKIMTATPLSELIWERT